MDINQETGIWLFDSGHISIILGIEISHVISN